MKTKPKLDMNKIARTLGAERKGRLPARSGHFGALELVAELKARLRSPATGGRATDPAWTERRLVALAPRTLARLEQIAARLRSEGVAVDPLQVAAILLEHAAESAEAEDVVEQEQR